VFSQQLNLQVDHQFGQLSNQLINLLASQAQCQVLSLVRGQPLNLVTSPRANHPHNQVHSHLCSLLFNQRDSQVHNLLCDQLSSRRIDQQCNQLVDLLFSRRHNQPYNLALNRQNNQRNVNFKLLHTSNHVAVVLSQRCNLRVDHRFGQLSNPPAVPRVNPALFQATNQLKCQQECQVANQVQDQAHNPAQSRLYNLAANLRVNLLHSQVLSHLSTQLVSRRDFRARNLQ